MIESFYAIEISGKCNLSCSYCPYRLHQRERGLMDRRTLEQVLSWISSEKVIANRPLHLHLFGEPMLHPDFEDMAKKVKTAWPHLSFSTNGTLIDPARAKRISEVGFSWVTVSPHAPDKAWKAAFLLRAAGAHVVMHDGPDHSWGGKVENPVKWRGGCEFSALNKVVIRWNGDVAVCCIDDGPEAVIGTVWDEDLPIRAHKAISLCRTCHLERSERW